MSQAAPGDRSHPALSITKIAAAGGSRALSGHGPAAGHRGGICAEQRTATFAGRRLRIVIGARIEAVDEVQGCRSPCGGTTVVLGADRNGIELIGRREAFHDLLPAGSPATWLRHRVAIFFPPTQGFGLIVADDSDSPGADPRGSSAQVAAAEARHDHRVGFGPLAQDARYNGGPAISRPSLSRWPFSARRAPRSCAPAKPLRPVGGVRIPYRCPERGPACQHRSGAA